MQSKCKMEFHVTEEWCNDSVKESVKILKSKETECTVQVERLLVAPP